MPLVSAGEYQGSFELDQEQVQLGDEFTLNGHILYSNGTTPTLANIYFKSGDLSYKTIALIQDNSFTSTNSLTFDPNGEPLPKGIYEVDIILEDNFDNVLAEFNNILDLEVDTSLILSLELAETQILPGSVIEIIGSAMKSIGGEEIEAGQMKISIDGEDYQTSFSGEGLSYNVVISGMAKSYYHDIEITMQDEFGNHDSEILRFYVIPVPTKFEINLEQESFLPSNQVKITPILYDQANDQIAESVEVRVYTPNGNKILQKETLSGEIVNFVLPDFATPGNWVVKAKSLDDFKIEETFNVEIVKEIEVKLNEQNLEIRNIGNVNYDELFEVEVIETGEYVETLYMRSGLDPDETMYIELYKEIPSGEYNINVINTNQTFDISVVDTRRVFDKFKDFLVGVTGEVTHSSGSSPSLTSTYVLFILFIVGALSLSYRIRYSKKTDNERKRDKKVTQGRTAKLKERISTHKQKLKNGKEEDNIADLKKRILRDIDKAKVKRGDNSFAVNSLTSRNKEPVKSETKDKIDILRELQQAKVEARKDKDQPKSKIISKASKIDFDQPLTQSEQKSEVILPSEPKKEEKKEGKKSGLFSMFD